MIWAAGVRASPFGEVLERRAGAKLDRGGRALVNPDLSFLAIPKFSSSATWRSSIRTANFFPASRRWPCRGGGYAAKLIQRSLRGQTLPPFRYFDKGSLAVIGRASAVADIRGLHISGLLAWFTWLFVHLMYLVEFSNRVLVFIQWGFLYLTYSRGARLITGPEVPVEEKEPEDIPRLVR